MNKFIPFLAVEASAGSGKTFTLAIRYISLLFMGVHPSKILALTFTNKAAGEMNERISNILLTLESRSVELEELEKITGIKKASLLEEREKVLNSFLSISSRIMTIDKFFNQILRSFSLYGGVMPNFEIKDFDEEQLFKEYIKALDSSGELNELIYISYLEDYKKTKLFQLFKTMEDKSTSFSIENLDYSVKTILEEEISRLTARMEEIIEECPVKTTTMVNSFTYDTIDELAGKKWLERDTLNYRTFSKCFCEELDVLLAKLKETLYSYYKVKESFVLEKIYKLFNRYETVTKDLKKKAGSLSFWDVTYFTKKILESVDREFIYFRLDSKIEHMLIDEFQDTSGVQLEILAPLIEEIVSGKGVDISVQEKSFFFVGDTKQSIYRFRGGDWKLFSKTQKLYNLKKATLKINFRSAKNVVNFNNELFLKLYPSFVKQQSRMESMEGYVEVLKEEDIEKSVVKLLKDLLQRNTKPKDILILVYTNDDSIKIADLIKATFSTIGVITDTSGKLINYPVNRAVIESIKYLYYKEEIYLKNLNALIGSEPFTDPMEFLNTLSLEDSVASIGKMIVENYELYDGDPNIVKFFSVLEGYRDIFDFIENIENETGTIDKGSSEGVSVLTIHKSKGLEFDNVIVCDRFSSRMPVNRDSLVFDYEESKRVFYRYKGRAAFDKEYKKALEIQKEEEQRDLVNSLYVALTRAKNELYIVAKPEKSTFDILDLKEAQIGTKIQHEPFIHEKTSKKKEQVVIKSFGKQQEFLVNKNTNVTGDYHSVYLGNAIHFCLEVIESFNKEALESALVATNNRYGLYVDMERVRKIVLNLFSNEMFQTLTKNDVYKEQSIVFNNSHFIIDLLCKVEERIYVCDYKSGSKKPEHIEQVKGYIEAVKKVEKNENTKGFLCYIGDKNIDWISVD